MRVLIITVFCSLLVTANAQQDNLSGMFWNNYAYFNPSLTGFKYHHQAYLNYRSQWVDGDRTPKDLFANYAVDLANLNFGLGMTYNHEEIGFYSNDKALVNASYHIKTGEKSNIAIGVNGGVLLSKLDGTYVNSEGTNLEATDLQTLFTLDVGISFQSEIFMLGIGSININNPSSLSDVDSIFDYVLEPTYNTFLEYKWSLSDNFSLMPRVMIQTDLIYFTGEVNAQLQFKDKIMLGVGVRTNGSVLLSADFDLKKKFRMGYQYELNTGDPLKVFGPSHEAVLGFLIE